MSFRSRPPQLSPAVTLLPTVLSHPSSSSPPPLSRLPSPAPSSSASKIDSLRSKVDLLKLPLALSTKSISERKSQLGGVGEQRGTGGGGGARKARSPPTRDMDNESQYSGYSYKSSHSRSSRKHRWVRRASSWAHYSTKVLTHQSGNPVCFGSSGIAGTVTALRAETAVAVQTNRSRSRHHKSRCLMLSRLAGMTGSVETLMTRDSNTFSSVLSFISLSPQVGFCMCPSLEMSRCWHLYNWRGRTLSAEACCH